MYYKIAWRPSLWRGYVRQWVEGLSRYRTKQRAQRQVDRFRELFPFNDYIIKPLK